MKAILDAKTLAAHPLPVMPPDGDKEDRGAVLVVGGEDGMAGAALLAGMAALRVGAGKLQIAGRWSSAVALSVSVPEAKIVAFSGSAHDRHLELAAEGSTALVLGPGMETRSANRKLARRLMEAMPEARAVVDAGALPSFGKAEAFAGVAAGRVVLTPHAGEMAALLDREKADIKRDALGAAREAAALFQSVVVMKGVATFIVTPDGTAWRHDGGVNGLGTSGSGDVLAGAIGGLLARGASPLVAALWGVRLHAEAGAAIAAGGAPLGFLARDLLVQLPLRMADAEGLARNPRARRR